MKKQILTSILFAASALAINSSAFAAEDCASGADQIASTPTLASLVNEFGGVEKLVGFWKLSGLAGSIQPTTIQIMVAPKQFSDQVWEKGGLDKVDIVNLCVNSSEPDVLYVRPVHAIDPDNSLIRIKDVQPNKSINISNSKHSNLTFKSVAGFPTAK